MKNLSLLLFLMSGLLIASDFELEDGASEFIAHAPKSKKEIPVSVLNKKGEILLNFTEDDVTYKLEKEKDGWYSGMLVSSIKVLKENLGEKYPDIIKTKFNKAGNHFKITTYDPVFYNQVTKYFANKQDLLEDDCVKDSLDDRVNKEPNSLEKILKLIGLGLVQK